MNSIKIAESFVRLTIVVMVFECFMLAFATPRSNDLTHKSLNAKSLAFLLSSTLMAEAEVEGAEEEGNKAPNVELVDFSNDISFLSKIHTHRLQFIVYNRLQGHQPSLFKLFSCFII